MELSDSLLCTSLYILTLYKLTFESVQRTLGLTAFVFRVPK